MHPRFFLTPLLARPLTAIALLATLSACAPSPPRPDSAPASGGPATQAQRESPKPEAAPPRAARRAPAPAPLPPQDLTEAVLYEFLLAEIAGQRGDVGLAAQAYADLAKRTRDPRIARRATEFAVYARMTGVAVDAARVWLDTDPASLHALQTLAGLLLNTGRFEEVLPHLRRMLSGEESEPASAFMQIGRMLAGAQDRAGALSLIQRLAQDHAQLPQAHLAVAQAAHRADRTDLALEEIRRALTLRPDWEAAVLFEAQLLQISSTGNALERLAAHLRRYPKAREVRLNYARALVAEKRLPEARAEFQTLLADHPTNTEVIFAVALLSLQLGDHALAEGNLNRLLELNYRDKSSVRLYLGQVAEEQKRFAEALRWFGEVGPGEQFVPAQIRIAQVMAKQGRFDEGRRHLQRVAESNSAQRAQLVLAEAQLLRDASRAREAFDVVARALERMPEHPDLLYDHAMLAEKIDRIDILENSLRKLIGLRPDHAHAYNALGYSLADRNLRLPEARELIEKALKIAPDDAFIIDSMGWVLYRQGEARQALGYLRRAYAGRPDPEIAAHLAEVLWMLGERAEAEKILVDLLHKHPGNEMLGSTLKRLKPQGPAQ